MKKLLMSFLIIGIVGLAAFGAARSFFSDEEKSTGNTFQAGAIDLKVSNKSYYNLVPREDLSWESGDLTNQYFFNYTDLKPGDLGEDTIDLKVNTNPAYACMDIKVTGTPENGQSEPEALVDDTPGENQGELQNELHFTFWADDGDNVLETDEVGKIFVDNKTIQQISDDGSITLADSQKNVWLNPVAGGPMSADTTYYIGKVWCFGELTQDPVAANSEPNDPTQVAGFKCNGEPVTNASQTDGVVGDVMFTAVQSRNNDAFYCKPPKRIVHEQPGFSDGGWAGWSCPAGSIAVGGGIISSTNPVGGHGIAAPGAPSVDGATYPTYPHYTYNVGAGETGYVVHDFVDSLSNNITFYVDCLSK